MSNRADYGQDTSGWMTDPSLHNQVAWMIIFVAPLVPILHWIIGKSSSYGKLGNGAEKSTSHGKNSHMAQTTANIQQQQQRERHPFGPMLPSKWSWMFFESPNLVWAIVSYYRFYYGSASDQGVAAAISSSSSSSSVRLAGPNFILLLWFFLHYVHRAVIYPLNMSSQSKFPMGLMLLAFCYTSING